MATVEGDAGEVTFGVILIQESIMRWMVFPASSVISKSLNHIN